MRPDPAMVAAVSTARVDLVCEGDGVWGVQLLLFERVLDGKQVFWAVAWLRASDGVGRTHRVSMCRLEPFRVGGATWVDGGLLSDFPVELVDQPDAQPRWPTFGIWLSARPGIPPTHPVDGPVSLGIAAIETLVSNQDNAYIDDPCTVRRTIFVPAGEVSPIDFDITAEQRGALYQRGLQAGQQFLQTWNFAGYRAACGGPVKPPS